MKNLIKLLALTMGLGATLQAIVVYAYDSKVEQVAKTDDPLEFHDRLKLLIPNEAMLNRMEEMAEANPRLRKNLEGLLKQIEAMEAGAENAEPGP